MKRSLGERARDRAASLFDWASNNQPSYAIGASLIFVAATPLISFAATRSKGNWVWAILGIQVVVAVLAWLIPFLQRRVSESRLVEVEAQARVRVNDALDPLFDELGALVTAAGTKKQEQFGRVLSMLLSSGERLIGPDRSRACFFEMKLEPFTQRTSDGSVRTTARRTLQPVTSSGRSGTTRRFTPMTEHGKAMLSAMQSGESVHFSDLDTAPPAWLDASSKAGRKYSTFIAVPVKAKGRPLLGMLTVDNPQAGSLDKDDVEFLRLLAKVLAIAISASRADKKS